MKGKKGFTKGHKKIAGRKKGSLNKFTTLKNAFLEAFQKLQKDNKTELSRWGKNNTKLFYELISKMLPKEVVLQGDEKKPMRFVVEDAKKK